MFSYPLRRGHVVNPPLSPGVLGLRDVVNSLVPGRRVLRRVHLGGGDVVDLQHAASAPSENRMCAGSNGACDRKPGVHTYPLLGPAGRDVIQVLLVVLAGAVGVGLSNSGRGHHLSNHSRGREGRGHKHAHR